MYLHVEFQGATIHGLGDTRVSAVFDMCPQLFDVENGALNHRPDKRNSACE